MSKKHWKNLNERFEAILDELLTLIVSTDSSFKKMFKRIATLQKQKKKACRVFPVKQPRYGSGLPRRLAYRQKTLKSRFLKKSGALRSTTASLAGIGWPIPRLTLISALLPVVEMRPMPVRVGWSAAPPRSGYWERG
jgi:hypothetical protein